MLSRKVSLAGRKSFILRPRVEFPTFDIFIVPLVVIISRDSWGSFSPSNNLHQFCHPLMRHLLNPKESTMQI